MPFARASSLDRLLECIGGSVLGGNDTKSVSTQIAADWGTMVHGWKETGAAQAVNGRKNLPPLFEKKLKATGVRRDVWWPDSMVHELALAVKPFEAYAGLLDGTKDEKEAWKSEQSEEWATGTLDGYDWMFDVLWIDDLKTGRFVSLEEYKQQLRFYALAAARYLDYRRAVHVTLTHWPRYPVLSQPNRFGRTIEQDELTWFEKKLVDLRDAILRAKEDREQMRLVTGEHCTFCPSRKVCPLVGTGESYG